ncbi:transglycosylase SLT domain-containing protein [Maritalea mobilis]|uniref:transglycosylase SLT domain-containing protein n=1 Tax=Maritalea mobilis TaxID=483324 RepID=UPI001C95D363|nr:transglycosylase SLT domain-containing protein [Maritalea mobilis]MBY6200715.1 transglycosylase SLT domain-containing protein [Maritalea mobilis]
MAAKPLTKAVALAVCIVLAGLLPRPATAQDGPAGVSSLRPIPRPVAATPEMTLPGTPEVEVTAGQMVLAPPLADADTPVSLPPEPEISALAPQRSLRPRRRDGWLVPAARWDEHPRGDRWTAAVMAALRGPGAPLLDTVPEDIEAWCPGYINADRGQRAAFWAGLISALAWHESTHNPRAVGGGGQWFGLVQIAPGTARWRNCDVTSAEALLDGSANLRCGIRIMGITVPRDNVVSEGMRGVAADWGPFHSRRKREDMRNWVRSQDYCQSATRPQMRPAGLAEAARPGGSVVMEAISGPMNRLSLRPVVRPARAG